MPRDDRATRPFWLHQAAEYLLGFVLIAQGVQTPSPLVPALAGFVVVLNAALVAGPLGAFSAVSRRQHRVLDLVVIGVLVVAAALPMLDVDNVTRMLMLGVAAVLGVVWWTTSFEPKAVTGGSRSTDVAGTMGRWTGQAVKAARNRRPDPS